MDGQATIRLATFNILHGASPADGVVDLDRFSAAIASLDADILALQEVDHGRARSGRARLSEIAAAAMDAQSFHFFPLLGTAEDDGYGNALLSRFPGEEWHTTQLPRWPIRYPVPRLNSRRIVLRSDEPRGALTARFATPLGPLTVTCAHLSYLPAVRERQLARLGRLLRRADGPFILLGDLNLRGRWPARVSRLRPLASHSTFPADQPRKQIDHALTGGGVRAVRSEAVRLDLSDHQALVVDVRLTDRG